MANKSGNPNWTKGKPRPEKAGRKKGTPNKFTDLRKRRLRPVIQIAELCIYSKLACKKRLNTGQYMARLLN